MFKNFLKGFGLALVVMIAIALLWVVIKFVLDIAVTTLGFVMGLFAPWVLVLIIAVIAGIVYMNKHKEEVIVLE